MDPIKRRVVITGLGAITPLGLDLETSWQHLIEGKSGVKHIADLDGVGLPTTFGAAIPEFDPLQYMGRKDARHMDRYAQLAVVAAQMAMADAALEGHPRDAERSGVYFGTGIGGMITFCNQHQTFLEKGAPRVSPFFIPMMIPNMAAGHIAIMFGFRGPNATIVTACSSSSNAIGDAFRVIERGDADLMLTGGAEAVLIPLAYAGFSSMKALSTRNEDPQAASRPFDQGRDGFVMGEGAGLMVLEEREHALNRGARIYAEMLGYGMSSDAYHIVEPDPEGRGAAAAMRGALKGAGISPDQVDYVNAHATSTPKGDRGEALAILDVFGERPDLLVSSTKSATGHLLGAAGAVELIFTLMAMQHDLVPATINLSNPDPDLKLDFVPNTPRKKALRYALSNSFGFGGHNASLLVGPAGA